MEFELPSDLYINLITKDNIKLVTVSQSSYGWYISILIDIPDNTFYTTKTNKSVGIDWGVDKFATDSDGEYVSFKEESNYSYYIKLSKRLKELQRMLANKRNKNKNYYSSNRYMKLKSKISWIYERLTNIRRNFLHHITKMYVTMYDTIVIEDLKPSNMMKNHKLARSIAESMFYTWKVILTYKAHFYGKEVMLVNPKNTSQTCSSCGYVKSTNGNKLKLSQKVFKCEHCNLEIDRDYNAALNILNLA